MSILEELTRAINAAKAEANPIIHKLLDLWHEHAQALAALDLVEAKIKGWLKISAEPKPEEKLALPEVPVDPAVAALHEADAKIKSEDPK